MTARALAWVGLALAVGCTPVGAAGDEELPGPAVGVAAAADTSLEDFLEALQDSTNDYFGVSAAPLDTAGLDSLLAVRLVHPLRYRQPRRLRPMVLPEFAFNRADGPVWGGALSIGGAEWLGRLTGRLGYAAGPNDWLGGADYRKVVRRRGAWWTLLVEGGRWTASLDRDHPLRHLATLRAITFGKDRTRYLRLDGFRARLERESRTVRLGVGYRDMLERPLETTTTWNLAGLDPSLLSNLPAARGRANEFELAAAWRLPIAPITAEVTHHTSGQAIGSDFEYRRTRVALSGDFGLGRKLVLVPQAAYGRLSGGAVPQAAFYLGGARSLRSVPSDDLGGSGLALARLDLIGLTDVLAWARIPHPAAFPIQAGLFAGIGAAWGADPYGGPTVPGVDWPRAESWLSEAGVSLVYQPGIPDPTSMMRLNYAWPLGPGRPEETRWTVSYTRAMDLVKPFRW